MKFGKVGQVGLVTAIALVVATLFTACASLTVGFLFVPTNKTTPGQIQVYEVNSESGYLHRIPTSPFPSGGRDPIAEAVTPDSLNLYVVNGDDNNIVQFGIGTDGKLYPQSTINTPGSFPLALAVNSSVNSSATFVYVLDTLQPTAGCSLENPCPGAVAGYQVTTAATAATAGSFGEGSLGQMCSTAASSTTCTLGNPIVNSNGQTYFSLPLSNAANSDVLTPTAMDVTANGQFLYVTAYDASTTPFVGYLFGFSIGTDGSLTPVNGGAPYRLESQPAGQSAATALQEPVAVGDLSSGSLFVLDKLTSQIATYAVQSGGTLAATMVQGVSVANTTVTAATGNQPSSLTMDNNQHLYVANSLDSTVTGYAVSSSGTLSKIATYATGDNPIAVIADPRHIGYLYTVNFLGSSVSGYQIDATTGALTNTQASPYTSTAQPTTVSGVPHGGQVKSATN
jgi:6-phosphogluconolactonase (cycloisomerase 2 family)